MVNVPLAAGDHAGRIFLAARKKSEGRITPP
jgi:hypothetical protein